LPENLLRYKEAVWGRPEVAICRISEVGPLNLTRFKEVLMSMFVTLVSVALWAFFIWFFDPDGFRQAFARSPDDATITGDR